MKHTEVAQGGAQQSHDSRTPLAQVARDKGLYSNTDLATELSVSEAAIRKWHSRCTEVAPVQWLKVGGKHTELSRHLIADYWERVSHGDMSPHAWVVEMQAHFEQRPQVEVIPADVSTALATNNTTAHMMESYIQQLGADVAIALEQVDAMDDAMAADDMALFQAEVEAARQRGAQKAVIIHAAERQAQNEAAQQLRQRDIQRRTGGQ